MAPPESRPRQLVVKDRGAAPGEFYDQLALGTAWDIGARHRSRGEELLKRAKAEPGGLAEPVADGGAGRLRAGPPRPRLAVARPDFHPDPSSAPVAPGASLRWLRMPERRPGHNAASPRCHNNRPHPFARMPREIPSIFSNYLLRPATVSRPFCVASLTCCTSIGVFSRFSIRSTQP